MVILKNNFSHSGSIVPPPLADDKVVWWFWVKWAFALAMVFTIYLIAIIKAPIFHGDLFMNIDLGRIVLNPDTDWAITWMTKQGRPVFLFNYFGTVSQEYIFQTIGLFGPVIWTLVGALVAATIMLKWLIIRNIPQKAAFVLSMVFLLDPMFVQSYTAGRLDSWTIALCLYVCYLLRKTTHNLRSNQSFRKSRLVLSGGLAGISFFIWPSAIFLFPLILWELLGLFNEHKLYSRSLKKAAFPMISFCAGGLIAVILLMVPIYTKVYFQLNEVITALLINLQDKNLPSEQPFYRYLASFTELFRILKFSPFLPLLAFLSIIKQKRIGLGIAGFIAVGIMIFTVVYIHRVLYLLPYFIVAVAFLFQVNKNAPKAFLSPSQQAYTLALLIIWSGSLSIGAHTILSMEKMKDNEKEQLFHAAESMVGAKSQGVLTPYEFYFIGRSMGWKMYAPYTPIGGEKFTFEELEPLLPLVDYAILGASRVTQDLANQLTEEGLYKRGNFYIYKNPLPPDDGKTTNIKRLRNLFKIFKQPYGPYQLYAREMKK